MPVFGTDPRRETIRKIARLRAAGARKQFLEMAQPPQRAVVGIGGIDRLRDGGGFLGPLGLEQDAQPVAQEGAVGRVVG